MNIPWKITFWWPKDTQRRDSEFLGERHVEQRYKRKDTSSMFKIGGWPLYLKHGGSIPWEKAWKTGNNM